MDIYKVRIKHLKEIVKYGKKSTAELRKLNPEKAYSGVELTKYELIYQIVFLKDAPVESRSEIKKACELYESGLSVQSVAEKLKTTQYRIRQLLSISDQPIRRQDYKLKEGEWYETVKGYPMQYVSSYYRMDKVNEKVVEFAGAIIPLKAIKKYLKFKNGEPVKWVGYNQKNLLVKERKE